MTPVERRCLDAVLDLSRGDIAPSYAEIAAAMGVGKTSIHRAVHALVRLGFIERVPGKARSVRVVRSTGIGQHVQALIRQYGGLAVVAEIARQTAPQTTGAA
ncbi:LexA family protein [Asticcacaulis solisilvae]|uniref:LexA family protein n=1 Tax=Asticcacaulis solisilvae TaxID=1217274 RepID=UPI003FD89EE7